MEIRDVRNAADISGGIEKVPICLENDSDLSEATDFVYVLCSVSSAEPIESCQEYIAGCECVNVNSCSDSCPCVARFETNYSASGLLTMPNGCMSHHKPVYECNSACKCSQTCHNRVVQHGVNLKLIVFKTDNRGFGLKCKEHIARNTFVCEYAGEYLTHELARARSKQLSLEKCPNYYILALKEHLASGKTIGTYVDPMYVGNVGRFINHSCEPNLYMVPVRIHHNTPRLALFALRDIPAGQELTFHYGGVSESADTSHIPSQYKPCHCAAETCSGFLPFDKDLFDY